MKRSAIPPKTRRALGLGVLACALLATGCGAGKGFGTPYRPPVGASAAGPKAAARMADRVVVRYRSSASASEVRGFQSKFALKSLASLDGLRMGILQTPGDVGAQLAAMAAHPAVEFAEPSYLLSLPTPRSSTRSGRPSLASSPMRRFGLLQAAFQPNDPQFGEQWGLVTMGLPQVWARNAGSKRAPVAVLDTGVDLHHPDLVANLVPGASMLGGSGPADDHGHGTHVSGIIAAVGHNRLGITGVAPQGAVMPVKVLDAEGKGETGNIVRGIVWAVDHGAKIINMSLGGKGGSRALLAAVQYAQSKDVLVVSAMGNDAMNLQEYPAAYPGVVAVGATTSEDLPAESFTNYGSWISVSAPGQEIFSTMPSYEVTENRRASKELNYDLMDGTSMATPFVAGLASLLRSQAPAMSAAQVKARLEETAKDIGEPGFDAYTGHGRVDALKALLGP